jgi:hypothetical protein
MWCNRSFLFVLASLKDSFSYLASVGLWTVNRGPSTVNCLFKFFLRPLPAREISRLFYLWRLCGEKHIFNLGIPGNLAHFRHLLLTF